MMSPIASFLDARAILIALPFVGGAIVSKSAIYVFYHGHCSCGGTDYAAVLMCKSGEEGHK